MSGIVKNKLKLSFVLFMCVGVISAFWVARYYEKKQALENQKSVADSVQTSLSELTRNVHQSLEVYSLKLSTMRSFIYSTGLDNISHSLFSQYAGYSDFEENYPGARGFGFIRFVDVKNEATFIEQASLDRGEVFKIRSLSENPLSRFIIQYIEPEYNNQQAIGLDVGSEGHRRSAALSAVSQNTQILTAPITLVQADSKVKHGFLLLLPVFDLGNVSQQKNNLNILGWVYAPLLIDEIIAAIQGEKSNLNLQISDINSGSDIGFYNSQGDNQADFDSGVKHTAELSLFGREWRMTASPKASFISALSLSSPSSTYYLVLGLFTVGVLLLSNCIYFMRKHFLRVSQKTELAAVVENGIQGTIGLDEEFCLKYWNGSAQKLFGFSDSSLGMPFLDWLIGTYSADYLIDLFRRVSQGSSIKDFEVKLGAAKGVDEKFLNLNFQPIFQHGIFIGANISMADVSEVRALQNLLEEKNQLLNEKLSQQNNELKQSASLHDSLIQGADFLIISTDLKGFITSTNRKLEEVLDYSQEELLGEPITNILGNNYLSLLSSNIFLTFKYVSQNLFDCLVYPLKHQSRVLSEGKFIHKNSNEIELHISISAISSDQEKVLGYLFIVDDIREQKALKFDLDLVSSAVHHSEDFLLWFDTRGTICRSNPHARAALGYSEYELKRLNIKDILPLGIDEIRQGQSSSLKLTANVSTENNIVASSGKSIPCLITISKLEIGGDEYLFLSAKDLSGRIVKEQALEEALNLAAQANVSKDQFLANMGHELRTPLNEVNGSLQLMQLTDLSSVQVNYLSQAKTSVRALTQSIDDVLDCGEIIRNKLSLHNEDLDMLDVLNSVGQACAIISEDKNIEVHFDISDNVPQLIHSDPHRLYQLLMCLMNNAIKFTYEGDVVMRCFLVTETEVQYELGFQVVDSGVGIGEEKLGEIFDQFSQVEMGADRAFGGLGLGLTISKTIIELMKGSITCQSKLGMGSTFSFNVMVDKAAASYSSEELLAETPALKVLVVDDNEISLSVLTNLVRQLGWQVTNAAGADAAFEKLNAAVAQNEEFDLALIDWNMPEKSGLDLVKDIRKQFTVEAMPILVMVTAYTRKMLSQIDNRDIEHLLSAFLTKPVTRTMLIDLVSSVLGSEQQGRVSIGSSKLKLEGFRVLLVEDNETNQFIAKNLLQSQGAIVAVASEGEEAWNILNEQPDRFDVVLMDIQMPGWDGYHATKEIRADKRFDDLPILAMTANVMSSDKRKCFDVGMNGHIGKPFELTQLVQEILSLARKPALLLNHRVATEKSHQESGRSGFNDEFESASMGPVLIMLKELTKVNVIESLNRFAGSEELYLKSLRLFIKDLENYSQVLTQNASGLSFEIVKPVFHTLKGTAGLLGFKDLSNLSAECEQLITMLIAKGHKAEPLSSLIQLMDNTKVIIESIFEKTDNNSEFSSGDESHVSLESSKLQQLREQLSISNMQSIELYSELKHAIFSLSPEIDLALDEAISKLDFKSAIKILDKIEKEYSELIDG